MAPFTAEIVPANTMIEATGFSGFIKTKDCLISGLFSVVISSSGCISAAIDTILKEEIKIMADILDMENRVWPV